MSTASGWNEPLDLDKLLDLNGSLVGGCEVAGYVGYGASDVLVVEKFLEDSGEAVCGVAKEWELKKRENCFGNVTKVDTQGKIGLNHVTNNDVSVGAVLTGSGLLKKMVPTMYQMSNDGTPCVLHVAGLGKQVENDFSDLAAVRETGFAILCSTNVQEVHDMAVIAHVAAQRSSIPFINFFDGTRVGTELCRVKMINYETLGGLIGERASGGNTFDIIDNTFQQCMSSFTNNKRYQAFEYYGPADAEAVIVVLGCSASTLLELVRSEIGDKTRSDKWKVGIVSVRVLRPWSTQHLLSVLPNTIRKVCVVDQNKSGKYDTPLFKDVAASFHSDAQWVAPTLVSANIVNSSSIGFTPAIARAIVDNLLSESPKPTFTIGDVKMEKLLTTTQHSSLTKQVVCWTMGNQAKESRHAISLVAGPILSLYVQQHDSTSLKTQVNKSDIRFGPTEIYSEYPVLGADVIAVDDIGILLLPQCNILAQAKRGTKLLLNCPYKTVEEVQHGLSEEIRSLLFKMEIELYVVDTTELVPSPSSNWIVQSLVLKLIGNRPVDYRQSFQHFAKLIHTHVENASTFLPKLVESNLMENVMIRIPVPGNWELKSQSLQDVHDPYYVPIDMIPSGMISHKTTTDQQQTSTTQQEGEDDIAYLDMLNQLFGDRLVIADTTKTKSAAQIVEKDISVESCYGSFLVKAQARNRLVSYIGKMLSTNKNLDCSKELLALLGIWHGTNKNATKCEKIIPRLVDLLNNEKHKAEQLQYIYDNRQLLHKASKWIVGGDYWSYDISNSGIHHILASGEDINVILVDTNEHGHKHSTTKGGQVEHSDAASQEDLNTSIMSALTQHQPSSKQQQDNVQIDKRKRDVGLYAMNYGTAYVASVSILSSQSQTMRAIAEADNFKGPSIIIAHLPPQKNERIAHQAVESGAWPLYRWNPNLEKDEFMLDSTKLKSEIQEFLKREQQLSMLANAKPNLPESLTGSLDVRRSEQHEKLTKEAELRRLNEQFDSLADGLGGGNKDLQLVVLYGSDSGNASGVAETLAKKAEASGCGEVRCMEANEFNVMELSEEKHVLVVLATAGQGEPCANAKHFTESILDYSGSLRGLKFAVFGLGDSHYWGEGSADSAKYFCLNAREVDEKLAALGAERLTKVGLGDDQNDDGFEGALGEWEPAVWDALQVTIKAGATAGGAPEIIDDDIKVSSNFLRGMIDEGLQDLTTGKLLPEDTKLTKFHGIYQQDLRSVREELDAKGLERAYSFMIRIGVPGGVATSEQYIAMDEICSKWANGALKVTTRQAYQLHGVVKKNLKTTMKAINRACMDTLSACGDVNRAVIANPHMRNSKVNRDVTKLARALQAHLRPKTSAYAEIWLDKKPVAGTIDEEPIYGPTYLPRKFKIAIAVPPLNDVDVTAHCLGFIAIVEQGHLIGYNITVGGGMGTTFGNKATYPRLADVLGFCTPEQCCLVAEKIVMVQRDYGDRTNRKHARLKYTVEDLGLNFFRNKVEEMCGFKLGKAKPFKFDTNADPYGWHQGEDGSWSYTMFVENGYIKDREDYKIKTGLREIAEFHVGGEMYTTATQNVIIGNISPERKPKIEALLRKYHIDNSRYSALRLHSMACVALPTCALAMAASQTYMPSLITKLEETLDEAGLRHDAITMRMTGCPNGCARPYIAEIGLVGKAPGRYNLLLGGGFAGNRISKPYKEGVDEQEILEILKPLFHNYATQRNTGERFGDFLIRTGVVEATLHGKCFWSNGPENDLSSPSGTNQIYW